MYVNKYGLVNSMDKSLTFVLWYRPAGPSSSSYISSRSKDTPPESCRSQEHCTCENLQYPNLRKRQKLSIKINSLG